MKKENDKIKVLKYGKKYWREREKERKRDRDNMKE